MSTQPSAPRRLFIGVMASPQVQAAVDAHRGRWSWPVGVRLTPRLDLHLTLHFLGAVDASIEQSLRAALARVPMTPSVLTLSVPGLWAPGIAILHVDADDALRQLHADLARVLGDVGLPVETRPWAPHLTLARKAGGAVPPAAAQAMRWAVGDFALVWSRPPPRAGDAGYQVLERWPARAR